MISFYKKRILDDNILMNSHFLIYKFWKFVLKKIESLFLIILKLVSL